MTRTQINIVFFMVLFLSASLLRAGSALSIQQAVKQEVQRYYLNFFKVPAQQMHVDFIRLSSALPPANRVDQIRVSDQHGSLKLGYRTLWVSLLRQSRLVKKFPVSVKAAIEGEVLVNKQRIARHAQIKADLFRREKRLISSGWDKIILNAHQVDGWESRQIIPDGTVLTKDLLRPRPLVHRGQQLKAELIAGNIVVELTAVARADGVLGDVIPVKALPQGKKLKARVSGAGYVVIQQEF